MAEGLTPAALALQIQTVIDRSRRQTDAISTWLGGTAIGGPNNDGRYPFLDQNGGEVFVPAPATFADMVLGPSAKADVAKVAAELARDAAKDHADRSTAQRSLAEAARGAAVDARNLAQQHRNHAGTHEANARHWAELAQSKGHETSADREAVEYLAEQVSNDATATASNAQNAAASAALAATFDPALFDKKSDTLASSRLTGMIDPGLIPVLVGQTPVVSSGTLANLTTAQQNSIKAGTLVATTDGRRWVYSGIGSKSADANYIEQGDVTPEWSVIANRPAFFPSNIANVAGLQSALDGKSPASHVHGWDTITGKPVAFPPESHSHTIDNVTGLQTTLSAKQNDLRNVSNFELGQNLGADSSVYIDFHAARISDPRDHNARIVRYSGANGSMEVVNVGTGAIGIKSGGSISISAVGGIGFDKRPIFAGSLAWDAGNFDPATKLGTETGTWHRSADSRARFHYTANGRTFFGSQNGYEWRSASDTALAILTNAGELTTYGQMVIQNSGPTLHLRDTDHRSAMIHVNSNTFHILRGTGVGAAGWEMTRGAWPMTINLENNDAFFGGEVYAATNAWFRVRGTGTGLYWEQHQGGWMMTDNTWLRSYNDKNIVTGGTVQMGAFTVTSDRRLKTDIVSISPNKAARIIDATNVYEFTKGNRRMFGMLAQEAREIAPILVSESADLHPEDGDSILALDQTGYIPLLIAEVQSLRRRVLSLESGPA